MLLPKDKDGLNGRKNQTHAYAVCKRQMRSRETRRLKKRGDGQKHHWQADTEESCGSSPPIGPNRLENKDPLKRRSEKNTQVHKGVPASAQWLRTRSALMRMWVRPLPPVSGGRIRHRHGRWRRPQTQLRSCTAAAVAQAGGCSSHLPPRLGTSMCPGAAPKSQKQTDEEGAYVTIKGSLQKGDPTNDCKRISTQHRRISTHRRLAKSPKGERDGHTPTVGLFTPHLQQRTDSQSEDQ